MVECADIEADIGRGAESGLASVVSDLDGLGGEELAERFRELELMQRRVSAGMGAIAGEVDRRGVYLDDGHRGLSGWLRAHGNYAQGTVTRHRRLARLVADLPDVGDDL
jgi:hypothetical protein